MAAVIDSNAIQAVFAQPDPEGVFERDYAAYLRSIGARRPVLFLAFAPKVAGTFHLCADGEVTAFVVGGDLPQGRVAAQLSFMLGGAFDAL